MHGTGLPTALAMKLARPEPNVVVATGDGGFGVQRLRAGHGGTPRNQRCGGARQRHGVGYGPPDSGRRLRAAGGDRSAADPQRRGGARTGRPQLQRAPAVRTAASAAGRPRGGPSRAGARGAHGGLPLRQPTLGGSGAALARGIATWRPVSPSIASIAPWSPISGITVILAAAVQV